MSEYLQGFLRNADTQRGIYSVCSAHPWVIEAAMRQACADGTYLLLEATSNQVNQTGGYTGMTPPDFRDFVNAIAEELDFDVAHGRNFMKSIEDRSKPIVDLEAGFYACLPCLLGVKAVRENKAFRWDNDKLEAVPA